MKKPTVKRSNPVTSAKKDAVAYLFDESSHDLCTAVRNAVDTVLASASDNALSATSDGTLVLQDYLLSSVIGNLYVALNQALIAIPGNVNFTAFKPTDIKPTEAIGDLRAACYSQCQITCSHN